MPLSVFSTCGGLSVVAAFSSIQLRTLYTCHSERSFANAKRSRRISDLFFVGAVQNSQRSFGSAQDDNFRSRESGYSLVAIFSRAFASSRLSARVRLPIPSREILSRSGSI